MEGGKCVVVKKSETKLQKKIFSIEESTCTKKINEQQKYLNTLFLEI